MLHKQSNREQESLTLHGLYPEQVQCVGETHVMHGHDVVLGSQTGLVTRGGVHRLEGHLGGWRQSTKHTVWYLVQEIAHEPATPQ
jgi:hypothetical protein